MGSSPDPAASQTIEGLRRLIEDRGFTVFNVIDHSGALYAWCQRQVPAPA